MCFETGAINSDTHQLMYDETKTGILGKATLPPNVKEEGSSGKSLKMVTPSVSFVPPFSH